MKHCIGQCYLACSRSSHKLGGWKGGGGEGNAPTPLSVRMEQVKCYYIELSASRYLKDKSFLTAMKLLKQLPYVTVI